MKKKETKERAMSKVTSDNFDELLKSNLNRFTDPGSIRIIEKNKDENRVKEWNNMLVLEEWIKDMENYPVKPRCKEAMEYVKAHVYMPVSDQEFIIIEKYVAEKHDSLFSDEEYLGDGDLIRYVCGKLEEDNMLIPQIKVEAIVGALYDFMFENGMLLPISLTFQFDEWYQWDFSLSDAIHAFYVEYKIYPTFILLSSRSKSQIDFINTETPKSKVYDKNIVQFLYSDVIDNKVETCKVKFRIDESIPYQSYILLHEPDNDDNNGDSQSRLVDPTVGEKKKIKLD